MPGYLVPTNTVDQSTTVGGYNVFEAVNSGAILQLQNFQITDAWVGTGSAERITPLTGTITPLYATSKIFIQVNSTWGSPAGGNHFSTRLRRTISGSNTYVGGATNTGNRISGLGGGIANSYLQDAGGQADYMLWDHTLTYLDSPNTTLPTTYTVTVNGYGVTTGSYSIFLNRTRSDREGGTYDPRQTSSVTLMEVAG